MSNRIQLKGFGRQEEASAAAALQPGHLIEIAAAGTAQKHSTEGGRAERLFAAEDALQGKTINDAYAAGDIVTHLVSLPGDEVQAILKAGENVAAEAELISAGDGTLIALASAGSGVTVEQVVARAKVALDLSGSGAVDTHIRVRVA